MKILLMILEWSAFTATANLLLKTGASSVAPGGPLYHLG